MNWFPLYNGGDIVMLIKGLALIAVFSENLCLSREQNVCKPLCLD